MTDLASSSPPWLSDLVRQSQQRNWREGETCRALFSSYSAALIEVQASREDKALLTEQVCQLRAQIRSGGGTGIASKEATAIAHRLAALEMENAQLHTEVTQWEAKAQAHASTQTTLEETRAALAEAQHETKVANGAYDALHAVYTEREQETNIIKAHFEVQQDNLEQCEAKLADAMTQIENLKRELRKAKKKQQQQQQQTPDT